VSLKSQKFRVSQNAKERFYIKNSLSLLIPVLVILVLFNKQVEPYFLIAIMVIIMVISLTPSILIFNQYLKQDELKELEKTDLQMYLSTNGERQKVSIYSEIEGINIYRASGYQNPYSGYFYIEIVLKERKSWIVTSLMVDKPDKFVDDLFNIKYYDVNCPWIGWSLDKMQKSPLLRFFERLKDLLKTSRSY